MGWWPNSDSVRDLGGGWILKISEPNQVPPVRSVARSEQSGQVVARKAVTVAGWTLLVAMVVWTAILAKESRRAPMLLETATVDVGAPESVEVVTAATFEEEAIDQLPVPSLLEVTEPVLSTVRAENEVLPDKFNTDPNVRWFNGRPVRPVRTMWMTVTAYSPDARSCGDSADGITATLHSVETNGFRLVAADPRVLGYGSMITVPGYDNSQIVPVLDCGGAIKGRRLDLLFPTHEEAIKWGKKKLKVTIWGFADGKPAENPRKLRG
jgi:3D (Asp-Asp-Asp) domain-containing protein